mmetsp:Transcript_37616/g.43220  ORF Transcript_37616/g.43220 Transcript_37616/m.43220 type:complete len:91 (+) Transcript_37616:675-947(+)
MSPFLSDEKQMIMNKVFQLFDKSHCGTLSIVQLLQAQASVPCDTQFSEEITSMIEKYVDEVLLGKKRIQKLVFSSLEEEMYLKSKAIYNT